MRRTKNKSISARSRLLLLAGFVFFINPVPSGVDILPDVFGCALIFFGLTQLAYFDGSIEEAKKSMIYLFAVEFIKLLLMRSVFLTDINSNRMLAATAFSIVEGILYIMFFRQLFGGISYFAMRNDCNKTLAKCDGTAFMSYLAFFTRIAATLLPELLAITELRLNIETDFDKLDAIADAVSIKPVLIVLLSAAALVIGVSWYVSLCSLLKLLQNEAGMLLDERYRAEFSARPEMVRPKRLKTGSFAIYLALFFNLDIVFDGVRAIPASAMFLILFAATFFLKSLLDFRGTRRFSLPAFVLLAATEIFRGVFVPYGAVVIYETKLWIIAVAAVMCLTAVPFCLLCVRHLLSELNALSVSLGGNDIDTSKAWISYCVSLTLWSIGFVIPYFYPNIAAARLIASGIFIWQTCKAVSFINEQEAERVSLYGK